MPGMRARTTTLPGALVAALALASPATADVGFSNGASITGLANPNGAVVADMNADGHRDIVVPSFGAGGSITIHRGDGGGSWTASAPLDTDPSNEPVAAVAVGHLDANSQADLVGVTFSEPTGRIARFLGDGAGGAGTRQMTSGGARLQDVALVDVDGDRDRDVVTASVGPSGVVAGRVLTSLNDGAGVLAAPTETDTGLGNVWSLDVGDVNEDGRPDLAVASFNNGVRILLGTGQAATPWAPTSFGQPPIAGNALRTAVLADLDGDSHLDVAVDSTDGLKVALGDGQGGFSTPRTTAPTIAGTDIRGLAIGDLDGDGLPDAVTADFTADTVRVLHNAGDGRFTAAATVAVDGPINPTIADIDRDGARDLVLPSDQAGSVLVRLNRAVVHADDADFGGQVTGGPGPVESVVFHNDGGAPVTAGAASIATGEAGDFSIVAGEDGCSMRVIELRSHCTIRVRFTPGAAGARATKLTLPGAAAGGASGTEVDLTGRGIDPVTGPEGPQGDVGPQGPQGDIGPQGPAGDDGAQGPEGPAGPAGDDGAAGPAGPAGTTGVAGPAGPAGSRAPPARRAPPAAAPRRSASSRRSAGCVSPRRRPGCRRQVASSAACGGRRSGSAVAARCSS